MADASGLSRNAAELAVLIATCMHYRRLTPGKAVDLIAQFPSMPPCQCTTEPDRTVSWETIIDEIGRALGIDTTKAERVMLAVFEGTGRERIRRSDRGGEGAIA